MYSIATAAAAVGRNKTAILRAINAGKISAAHDENGDWQINPAELRRIYPPLRSASMRANDMQLYQSPPLTPVSGSGLALPRGLKIRGLLDRFRPAKNINRRAIGTLIAVTSATARAASVANVNKSIDCLPEWATGS